MPFHQAGNQRRGRWTALFFFFFISSNNNYQYNWGGGNLGKTKGSRHDNTGAFSCVGHATPRHIMEPASFFFISHVHFSRSFQHSDFSGAYWLGRTALMQYKYPPPKRDFMGSLSLLGVQKPPHPLKTLWVVGEERRVKKGNG